MFASISALPTEKASHFIVGKWLCINATNVIIAGLFRVSLFIDLGFPQDLGKGSWGHLGPFMISRPINLVEI